MDVAHSLRRIAYSGPTSVSYTTLYAMHRAFTLAVPFENLDIQLGRPIVLNEEAFFDKIVVNGRGGICYELNGFFAAMLRHLGFDVTLLSARVFDPHGSLGREFGHLLVLVKFPEPYIVDAGFGDWLSVPLVLEVDKTQQQSGSTFRITGDRDHFIVGRHDASNDCWQDRYSFSCTSRKLKDFVAVCNDLQTAEDSVFRQRQICTIRTTDGRVTLSDNKIILTTRSHRDEIQLIDASARSAALSKYFGITLPTW